MLLSALLSIVAMGQSSPAHPVSKAKPALAKPKADTPKAGIPYLPPAPGPTAVLAKVNGVPIRAGEVDGLLWDWAGRGVMEDLILFQLIKNRAAIDHVTVSPQEVQKAFGDQLVMIQRQVPAGQDVDAFIREKGFPKSRLYMHLEVDLLMNKIVDLQFKKSDYVSVSTMLIVPKSKSSEPKQVAPGTRSPQVPPTPEEKQEAIGRAMDIYKRLEKGEDWDTAMKSSDQSPQMLQTHGALGWRSISDFPPAIQSELRGLKPHQYSKPVETANGIQIFRIDDVGTNASAADLDKMLKQFEPRAKQTLLQELQSGAKVERFFGEAPKVAHLTKLGVQDIKVGVGSPVAAGDEVWVLYTGKFKDGKVFDSNAKPGGTPFHLTVGVGQVIKGWDQGLVGMRKGGKRKLSIPYELGYGSRGMGTIPANSDLYFDVELVDVLAAKDAGSIGSKDLVIGTGAAVKQGDTITVDYVLTANGQTIESKQGVTLKVGADAWKIPGFDQALVGVKVGGKRELRVPPKLTGALNNDKLGSNIGIWSVSVKSIN